MEIFNRKREEVDVNLLSPLTWAYVGDSVYELFIRNNLVNDTNLKPHKLHIKTIEFVKAKAQADILKGIMDELSDEEKDIVRRARNTQNHHLPKNADPDDYMYATAFEGLIGYLFLAKKDERLKEILEKCLTK
ncbi:MAG: Mini-ribonuclease 3 [Clostridia bacterium]|nr:Mini-ribonuclease 3 [Clostridia bacterium]